MSDQYEDCPWCGDSDEVEPGEVMGENSEGIVYFQTGCERCECCGPRAATAEESVYLWNRRATL